jgi:predicted acyltransferase
MPNAPQRVLSIDVLRGLTIAFMILVNDPGDWSHVYSQLDHAAWNGFTLTDFVFPNFLFLVGASIVFSLESRMARGNCKLTLTGHIFRRAATLFALKLFISAYPHFHVGHLRLYGVLTRIALCYLAAALICLALWNTRHRIANLLGIAAALLIGYWALMRFVPVPGAGVPTHSFPILDPYNNLAAWLDRGINAFTQAHLHTGSLYNKTRDPEGLLSTLPAIATTLIGCATGLWLRRSPIPEARRLDGLLGDSTGHQISTLVVLVGSGLLSLTLGLIWSPFFPINKNLWTSSYVLFAAGLSLLLLALFYWLIDIRRLNENRTGKWLLWPWLVFGSNAITAYVLSDLIVETAAAIKIPVAAQSGAAAVAKPVTVWLWTYQHVFARHGSTNVTSLAFALAFVAVCFVPNWLLWHRKIFLKI